MPGESVPAARPVAAAPAIVATGFARTRLAWEVCLVLAVTVGQSALYSLLSFIRSAIEAAQQGQNLADQQTELNPAQDSATSPQVSVPTAPAGGGPDSWSWIVKEAAG